MITEVPTGRPPAQMVWAAIWLDERGRARRSPLVIMTRDEDAPRGGCTAQSYIKTLETGLLHHWWPSQRFMHDNARIYTARITRRWLHERGITPITWPAYSSDLNPIEHLWYRLKSLMNKLYSQYNNFSTSEEEWDSFYEALKDCWRPIPSSLIRALILSMPRRIMAVRRAKG